MVYSDWGFSLLIWCVYVNYAKKVGRISIPKQFSVVSLVFQYCMIFFQLPKNWLKRSSGSIEHASMQYMSHTATCFSVYLWLNSRWECSRRQQDQNRTWTINLGCQALCIEQEQDIFHLFFNICRFRLGNKENYGPNENYVQSHIANYIYQLHRYAVARGLKIFCNA